MVDQASSNTKYSYDFDVGDSMGAAAKKEYLKFYKVERDKENDNMTLSSETTARHNSTGDIGGRMYKSRNHSIWVTSNCCSSKGMLALIHWRAEDKRLQEKEISFVRWVMFVMHI